MTKPEYVMVPSWLTPGAWERVRTEYAERFGLEVHPAPAPPDGYAEALIRAVGRATEDDDPESAADSLTE